MFTKVKIVTVILSLLTMTVAHSDAPNCDRNIYPKGKMLDLNTVDEVSVSNENCTNLGVAIQCVNQKTKIVVCFKCRNNKQWSNVKENIYTCN